MLIYNLMLFCLLVSMNFLPISKQPKNILYTFCCLVHILFCHNIPIYLYLYLFCYAVFYFSVLDSFCCNLVQMLPDCKIVKLSGSLFCTP